jgi:hypothetical protein
MNNFDFCLTWDWEYDADFVKLLEIASRSNGLSLLKINPENLMEMIQLLYDEKIIFKTFFDRASDTNIHFDPIVRWACNHVQHHINFQEKARLAWDKARMHSDISVYGHTPRTIILPSYYSQPMLPVIDLSHLGTSFTIKPAIGGGGVGVINDATSLEQVLVARQQFPSERYLLQTHIIPTDLGSQRAWFRVIYCMGRVYACWWNMDTHVYTPVSCEEEIYYNLSSLRNLTSLIADVCKLELFSTEIALTHESQFVIIDYVNDPIDLRLQSKAFDGVPDAIVRDIAETLMKEAGILLMRDQEKCRTVNDSLQMQHTPSFRLQYTR